MKFEGKLEIGGLAMIIGTAKAENRWLIGGIVTVEAILAKGADIGVWYLTPPNAIMGKLPENLVVVSDCKKTGVSLSGLIPMLEGHCCFAPQYLMPLSPLEEEQLAKDKELELS
jgi:carbonic anhydrase/acetyltransferase-like protein (isoleucine patch superfamily)